MLSSKVYRLKVYDLTSGVGYVIEREEYFFSSVERCKGKAEDWFFGEDEVEIEWETTPNHDSMLISKIKDVNDVVFTIDQIRVE